MARSVIALAVLLLISIGKSHACDACGCSVSGAGVGLMANYRQTYLGLQYQLASFSSTLEHARGATDYFHHLDLIVRLRLFGRLNLQFQQPYRLNVRRNPAGDDSRQGPGDTRLIAHYILFDQTSPGKNLRLYAEAGAGLKAPLGKFDPHIHDEKNLPENFNVGNGSWAYLLQSNIVLSRKNSGLALSGSCQLNRPTTEGYQFGAQASGQLLLFQQLAPHPRVQLTPFAGGLIEEVGQDRQANRKFAPSTGGGGVFALLGFNLSYDDWLLGVNYLQPVHDRYSNAEVKANARISIQFSYIL